MKILKTEEYGKTISNEGFLSQLNDIQVSDFMQLANIIEYESDEEIIKEGDKSNYLFVIIDGSVNVIVKQKVEDGIKDVYISTMGKGEVFGEAAFFLEMKRTAHVIANSDIKLIRIDRNSLMQFIKKNPAVGNRVLMFIIYNLLLKIKEVNHELAYQRQTILEQNTIDELMNDIFNR